MHLVIVVLLAAAVVGYWWWSGQEESPLSPPEVVIETDPESAACINAAVDGYLAELAESFRRTDENNPAEYPNQFAVTPEVTLISRHYVSLRFDEYYGLRAAAYPTSALSVMVDDLLLPGGAATLLARVEERIVEEHGDTLGADLNLEDLALFPDGIEVTIDEGHGLPHVLGRITIPFSWEEIADIVDRSTLSWLVGDILGTD